MQVRCFLIWQVGPPRRQAGVRHLFLIWQVASVPALVAALTPPRVREMRVALARMRASFLWGEAERDGSIPANVAPPTTQSASRTERLPGKGARRTVRPAQRVVRGLAYNVTVLALCRRAVELGGGLASGGSCVPFEDALTQALGLGALLPSTAFPSWFPPAVVSAARRLGQQRARQCHGAT